LRGFDIDKHTHPHQRGAGCKVANDPLADLTLGVLYLSGSTGIKNRKIMEN
jgi:hypothetical protein